MNILLSAYECDPNRGSEFGRSWRWAVNYVKRGHHVWCLTSERGKSSIETKLAGDPIPNIKFFFVSVPQWVEDKYKKSSSTLWVYVHYWFWLHNSLKKAKVIKNEIDFSWVHHVSWGSLQQGTELWKLNLPLVFGPVGGGQLPPVFLKKYFLEGWKTEQKRNFVSKVLLKLNTNTTHTLKRAKLILVVNEDTKKIAEKYNPTNTEYCIDIGLSAINSKSKISPAVPQNELRILWVGRLLYRKGLPLVLDALSKVPDNIPFKLTIIGDGPVGRHLPSLLKAYNLEKKVDWQGQLPFSDVQKAYCDHEVFMFCSLRESLGLQYFEAMAHGLPIITLDIHGAKNAIPSSAGIKVQANTINETLTNLAEAVQELYLEPEKRKRMGENGLVYVQELVKQNNVQLVEAKLNKWVNNV